MNGSGLENKKLNLSEQNKKILVVCMLDSVHTARWLNQFQNSKISFHLFPSTPHRKIHSDIKKLTTSEFSNERFKVHYGYSILPILTWAIDLVLKNKFRGYLITRLLEKFEIDVVHVMELNHAGFITYSSKSFRESSTIYKVATVWGSDIFWFGQFEGQRKKLGKLLPKIDLLISECKRDENLSRNLGFNGKFFNSPALFGFPESELNAQFLLPSKRNLILVKGYESFAGRASMALDALVALESNLNDFEIHVYSTTWKTRKLIKKIRRTSNLKIVYYKKKQLTSNQMVELFRRSRFHLGVSLSDGVPASLLEAMISGCFPIQTDTSCAEQWIENDKSGILVEPKVEKIKDAITKALRDDQLVDQAAIINQKLAREKLNQDYVASNLSEIYSRFT